MIRTNLLLAGDDGYNLTKSLRFRSSASAYLNRTFGTPTNAKKWTYSLWVKGSPWANAKLLSVCLSGSSEAQINFTGGQLQINSYNGAGTDYVIRTDAVYRDPSSWYHLVFVYDTDNATSTNRAIIYVNGVRQSVTAPNNGMFPSGYSHLFNTNGAVTYIGARPTFLDGFFDGYIAETNFVDGQALTPSSFGSTNALTGVWQPAKYTGTYGTNGFYLPFTNTTSTTTLGYDFSGNSNNWTTNNISLTAGSTYDSMTDVPTLTSATTANYATFNPVIAGTTNLINGNLTRNGSVRTNVGTMLLTGGKYYFETTIQDSNGNGGVGVKQSNAYPIESYDTSKCASYFANGEYKIEGNAQTSGFSSYTNGDIIGIAVDTTQSPAKIWFAKNNTWQGTGNPTTAGYSLTSGLEYYFMVLHASNSSSTTASSNFGQQGFTYTPPTGYVALNTYNLPTSTIVKGNTVMDAVLYTGTGGTYPTTTQSVTGLNFQPDFVWIKSRSNAYQHFQYDAVRTAGKYLASNSTDLEYTTTQMTSFNSNGFTVANDGGSIGTNGSGSTFVAWNWKANGTGSTNTSGSITSTVSVNASAGFSVVTYTGTGANATVGHGLGVAPKMVIVKNRTNTGSDWTIWQTTLSGTQYLQFNTSATLTNANRWNSTTPTSSVFSVGTSGDTNNSGSNYVAYCWTPIAGYSAIGSYTGNGSADGPFIYTGFRPRFVMAKVSSTTGPWNIFDSSRGTYNVNTPDIWANSANAETANNIDFLSNGFKIRDGGGDLNGSSATYIYMAFAESPFRNALAR